MSVYEKRRFRLYITATVYNSKKKIIIIIQCRWPVIFVHFPRENQRIGVTKIFIHFIVGYARNSVDIVVIKEKERELERHVRGSLSSQHLNRSTCETLI